LKSGEYTHCIRYNGGCNAGHTIFHNGRKFVTHHIPAGVFFGVTSIIGPGCVVNLEQFFKEIEELEAAGIPVEGNIFIARNTHVITPQHLQEDAQDSKIGTTKRGNGPAYRDKYARNGVRAETISALLPYLIDVYYELHSQPDAVVLCEGAQGFGLDIDWGDYPYVTSSHCTVGGAILNGIPPQAIRKVYGVAKAYETYVGAKKFEGADEVFLDIREVGKEYGATTGRPRQCNWMNLGLIKKGANINGVTDLIINKVDVLREVNRWVVRYNNDNTMLTRFNTEQEWRDYLELYFKGAVVHFSDSPERI
jgi:adenylosuccinate synthase